MTRKSIAYPVTTRRRKEINSRFKIELVDREGVVHGSFFDPILANACAEFMNKSADIVASLLVPANMQVKATPIEILNEITKGRRRDAAVMRDKYSRKDWYHGYFKAWDEAHGLVKQELEEAKRDSPTP